jgi:glycosyltransferase involved in cell wall biosynthesis
MRILFLSQLFPYPPDAGAKVRAYYTLRWLAEQHDVTLVAFTREDDPPAAIEHLRKFCREVHTLPMVRNRVRDGVALTRSLFRGESFIIRRDMVAEMYYLLRRLASERQFDVVHSDQLWMAQYALCVKHMQPAVRLVLDEHNACYQIFERLVQRERSPIKRWLWSREARLLRQYEGDICNRFDRVVTVTEDDRRILVELSQQNAGNSCIFTTIPICLDSRLHPVVIPRGDGMNVLHLGTMFWPPNVEGVLWFARQIWPQVVAEIPQARFSILGKNPPSEIQVLDDETQIDVIGYVSDPRPWLERTGVFIVPLLSGGGMRVKIIDAWRWGLPVVSTTIGAEGIAYQVGENILIADSPEEFIAMIVKVLRDKELSQSLRVNGRLWVETHYDWRSAYPAWDEVYG